MARKGPKRTPLATLRKRGSWLANNRTEPALPSASTDPPADLQGAGLAKWQELAPLLAAAGVLCQTDRDVLETYCRIWAELQELETFCRDKNGKYLPIVKTQMGNLIMNPGVCLRNTLRTQLKSYGACLGLSPADRSSVAPVAPGAAKSTRQLLEETRHIWDRRKKRKGSA